jgi:molybdopterin synthase sulfur carrier subunit
LAARLVFLGRLQDVAGEAERVVAPAPLCEILATLAPQLALAVTDERVRWALNGKLIGEHGAVTLGEGDELAFLPPVSGG